MNKKMIAVGTLIAVVILALAWTLSEARKPDLKSFPLRYLKGTEAADLLSGHLPPGAVEGWSENAVFVRAGNKELETVAGILQKEDLPKPQVTLRFQIIEADGFATRDTAIAQIESVLRGLFRFGGYRLAAEAYVQSRAESGGSQTVTGPDGQQYLLEIQVGDVARRDTKASADLDVRMAMGGTTVLATSVSVPDGQTIVLGTARPSANRAALILVVTPTIK